MKNYTVKVFEDGSKVWLLNGERHREDGPAIERANGNKYWYLHGELHREDGPAVERSDGTKMWYLTDELHREDGPAIERADGSKAWLLHGEFLAEEEHKRRTSKAPNRHPLEQALRDAWYDGYKMKQIEHGSDAPAEYYFEKYMERVVGALENGEE